MIGRTPRSRYHPRMDPATQDLAHARQQQNAKKTERTTR